MIMVNGQAMVNEGWSGIQLTSHRLSLPHSQSTWLSSLPSTSKTSSSSSPNKEWQNCRNHCSHHHDHHHHQNIEMSTWQRWAPRVGLSGDFNEDDARSMAKKENWNEENDLCKSKTLIKRIMMKIAHDYEHNDHAGILVQFNLNWLPLQVGSPNLATPCLCSRTTTDSMRYYWAIIIIIKVVSRVFLPFFLC